MTTEQELELGSAVISGIEALIASFKSAKSGAVDPATALSAITALTTSLAANDAAADTALDQKFKAT